MSPLEFCDARISEIEKRIAEVSETDNHKLKVQLERELANYKEMRSRYVSED